MKKHITPIPYRLHFQWDKFTDGSGGVFRIRFRLFSKWRQYNFEVYEAYKRSGIR